MESCKSHNKSGKNCPFKVLTWIGYAIGAAGVGYFLWVHQAHVLQYVPYLLLLACPLMHLLGGHGAHGRHGHCSHDTGSQTYICPMHPEVKQDKPGKCPKCGMNLEAKSQPEHGH